LLTTASRNDQSETGSRTSLRWWTTSSVPCAVHHYASGDTASDTGLKANVAAWRSLYISEVVLTKHQASSSILYTLQLWLLMTPADEISPDDFAIV